MKFGILSLAATAALALSSGTASAQWGHNHHHHGHGHNHSVIVPGNHWQLGPHLDYHRGHYHLHDGYYRSGPLYPVYGYGGYSNLTPGFYSVPNTGSWSSYGNGYPSRGSAYNSYRWRW